MACRTGSSEGHTVGAGRNTRRWQTSFFAGVLLCCVLLAANSGHAQSTARRTRADYDGRPAASTPVDRQLLWIPRVALAPLYVVTEYGLRAPLGWVLTNAEKHHVVERVQSWLRPSSSLLIAPTVLIDLGLITSGGIYLAWNHALHRDNAIRLRASTGGPGYWHFGLTDRVALGPRSSFVVGGDYLERRDWRFYGIGPDTHRHDEQRFDWARGTGFVGVESNAWERLGVELAMGARHDRWDSPALLQRGDHGVPTDQRLDSWYARMHLVLDTRPLLRPNTSGARLEASAEFGAEVGRPAPRRWANYDGEAAVFYEIKQPGRVLGLHAYAAFADPLGATGAVPLVFLTRLGGFETMRGWFVGRFWGESAAVFTASYRYPVWHSLDGAVYAEAGNAFEHHLAGFDVRKLFGSFGLGFRTTGARDSSIDFLLALGSSRFDAGAFGIESVRLAVGLNRGF